MQSSKDSSCSFTMINGCIMKYMLYYEDIHTPNAIYCIVAKDIWSTLRGSRCPSYIYKPLLWDGGCINV